MRKQKANHFLFVTLLLTLSACSVYRPTVDPYNDVNAYRLDQDFEECKHLAYQASGSTAKDTAIGAGVGGLAGAGGGAAIGAAMGDAGKGATIGAAIGGIGGAGYQALESGKNFKYAYQACMRNRGHNVIN